MDDRSDYECECDADDEGVDYCGSCEAGTCDCIVHGPDGSGTNPLPED